MSEAKEWYVFGGAPGDLDDAHVSGGFASEGEAVAEASEWVTEHGTARGVDAQYVYRLVPVKIVRRVGIIVEDVS